jgi:hypothetical protein
MYILVQNTNIAEQTNWIDDEGNPVPEPAEHFLRRQLRVEPSNYVLQPGENNYTPSSTIPETEQSILSWCEWGMTYKDFFFMVEQFREYRDVFGYAALNDDTKEILLKHFSAGPGNDYIDPLFSQSEYDIFYHEFEFSLTNCFIQRDKLVYQKMRKRVYQGNPTKAQATAAAKAIAFLRDNYIRDFFMAQAIDETDGVVDFLNNDESFQFRDIANADGPTLKYTVNNFNINTVKKYLGKTVQVIGSTGGVNDGFYTLEDVGKTGAHSWIEVNAIPDPNAADLGQIVVTGLKAFDGMTDTIRDECLDIYLNGI